MAKVGRPTKYKPEYAQMLLDYIDQGEDPIEEKEIVHTNRKGETWSQFVDRPKPLRFIGRFAQNLGVGHDTLIEWAKEHPEFSKAYARARELQGEHILHCGFLGLSDAAMSKFAAVNLTDLRDTTKQEVAIAPESLADIAALMRGAGDGQG